MSKNEMFLSLDGDTFSCFKVDFNDVLNRTVGNMQMKGATDAVITAKMSINLAKGVVNIDGVNREYNKPSFKHEVTSVLQIKDKASGQLVGDNDIGWDDDVQKFFIRRVYDGQTSIFDDDYETCGDEIVTKREALPSGANGIEDTNEDVDDGMNAFDVMMEYVERDLVVVESNGVYTVRDAENPKDVILSSGCEDGSPFKLNAEIAAKHIGHKLLCYMYSNDGKYVSGIAVDCTDCNETIFLMKAPEGCSYEIPSDEIEDEPSDEDYGYDAPEDDEEE